MTEQRPGDNRPPVYEDNGMLVVRASALGTCLWELIAVAQGHEPQPWPARMLRAFDEGHDREGPTFVNLEADGWIFDPSWAQREVDLRVGGNRVVRVHPDGAGFPPSQPTIAHGIEIKWLHNSSWQNWRRHGIKAATEGYKWQFSCEMAGMKMPLAIVIGNKGETPDQNGVRPPCADEGALHFEFVTKPPYSLAEIIKRVKALTDEAHAGDVVKAGRPCDNPKQYPCRFIHLRPEPENSPGVQVTASDVDEFERWSYLYNNHALLEKQHKTGREEARDMLIKLAGDNTDDLFTDHYDVHLARGSSTTTNWKKLCADKGITDEEIKEYQSTSAKTPTVTVKVK